jgi:hypothetical protein
MVRGSAPLSVEVLVQTTDPQRLIVGVGPFDPAYDPRPDGYTKYVLDDSQQAAVLEPSAYVCTDLQTVKVQPC